MAYRFKTMRLRPPSRLYRQRRKGAWDRALRLTTFKDWGEEEGRNQQRSLRKLTGEVGRKPEHGEEKARREGNLLTLFYQNPLMLHPGLSVCFMLHQCPLRIRYIFSWETGSGVPVTTVLNWDTRERSALSFGSNHLNNLRVPTNNLSTGPTRCWRWRQGWALYTSDGDLSLSLKRSSKTTFPQTCRLSQFRKQMCKRTSE